MIANKSPPCWVGVGKVLMQSVAMEPGGSSVYSEEMCVQHILQVLVICDLLFGKLIESIFFVKTYFMFSMRTFTGVLVELIVGW